MSSNEFVLYQYSNSYICGMCRTPNIEIHVSKEMHRSLKRLITSSVHWAKIPRKAK